MESDNAQIPAPKALAKQNINISGDTVTLATEEYPDEHKLLARWLYAWCKENDWSWKEAERETGLSSTTLYRMWCDKYRHPDFEIEEVKGEKVKRPHPRAGQRISLDSICERVGRLKELADERVHRKTPFVETSVWRRISKLCREALVMQTIGFIFGQPQVGKTYALKEYARRNNHGNTIYVLMPASAGVQAMLKKIARACNISERTSFEQLRERVQDFLDGSKLLIIDEVHECFVSYRETSQMKCLSVLRQLQEESGCGMVLCGTDVFRNEIEKGQFKQSLQQLDMRGIWKLQLEKHPSWADLGLIWVHYKLGEPDKEAAELVKWMGQQMGLSQYCKFLARGAQLAGKRGEKFGWKHFREVVAIAEKMKQREE